MAPTRPEEPKEVALDLADRKSLMASMPPGGVGAEIGVAQGGFSGVLLEVCKPKMLYLIDFWAEQSREAYSRDDPANFTQATHDANYASVCATFGIRPDVTVLKEFSTAAATGFRNGSFDWGYIDANHLLAGKDAAAWWPKIKPGGWMMGHDYTMVGDTITVKADIDAFVAKHGLELFVTRGDTDIYEKNYPSWAVRKP